MHIDFNENCPDARGIYAVCGLAHVEQRFETQNPGFTELTVTAEGGRRRWTHAKSTEQKLDHAV